MEDREDNPVIEPEDGVGEPEGDDVAGSGNE